MVSSRVVDSKVLRMNTLEVEIDDSSSCVLCVRMNCDHLESHLMVLTREKDCKVLKMVI